MHLANPSITKLDCASSLLRMPMEEKVNEKRPFEKEAFMFHYYFLFSGELTPSQFPVFTIYVQKNCLPSAQVCGAAWSFERVMDHSMDSNPITRAQRESRSDCMELCLNDDSCRLVFTYLIRIFNRDNSPLEKKPSFGIKRRPNLHLLFCLISLKERAEFFQELERTAFLELKHALLLVTPSSSFVVILCS